MNALRNASQLVLRMCVSTPFSKPGREHKMLSVCCESPIGTKACTSIAIQFLSSCVVAVVVAVKRVILSSFVYQLAVGCLHFSRLQTHFSTFSISRKALRSLMVRAAGVRWNSIIRAVDCRFRVCWCYCWW